MGQGDLDENSQSCTLLHEEMHSLLTPESFAKTNLGAILFLIGSKL